MLTGYLATLPQDCLLSAGVLFCAKGSYVPIGVTDGAPEFDAASDQAEIMFDNRAPSRLKGLTRVVGYQPVIKGTFKEFGASASGNQLAVLEPGESEATVSSVTTVTPRPAGSLFGPGEYIINFRWIFERSGGGYACLYAPLAIVRKWSAKGNDKKEAQISFEIEAVGDPVNDFSVAPYIIELRTQLPSAALAALTGATGALAVWPFTEGTGGYAYNASGPMATLDNIVGGPERVFSSTFGEDPWSNAFLTALTDDFGNNRNGAPVASHIAMNAGSGGFLIQSVVSLPVGTYTMSLDVASNTGSGQTFRMSHDNTATFSGDFSVPSSGWTRFSYTFAHGGGTANLAFVAPGSGATALDLLIYGAKLNTGSIISTYVAPSWDLELGRVGIYDATDMPTWNVGGWLSMQGTKSAIAISDVNAVTAQLSVYVMARWTGTPVLPGNTPLLSEHFNAAAGNLFWFDMGDTSNSGHGPRLQIRSTPIKDAYCMKPSDGAWHIFAATYDGTNFNLYCDDCLMSTTNAPGLAAITVRQILLGNFNQSAFWPGDIAMAAVYTSGHSGSTVATLGGNMRALAASKSIAIARLQKLVVWEGDSISDVGSGLGYYPRIASLASIKGAQGYNPALSGSTIATLNARAAAIDALYDSARGKNVLHLLCGANDSGIMGASYWGNSLKPYVTARRSLGWKVVVATILTRTDATGIAAGFPANRDACNAAIVADSSAYDGLSRFDLDPTMGTDTASNNATYFNADKLHPILAGHQILGPIAQAAVDALL